MILHHLLDAHAGKHTVAAVAAAAVAVKTPLFRRLVPRLRKQAVPGVSSASGAATQRGEHPYPAPSVPRVYYRPDGAVVVDAGDGVRLVPDLTYGQAPVASVLAAEEQAKGDAAAAWYQTVKPGRTTLERVRDGLRNLSDDRPDAAYRGGWQ